MKYRNLKVSGGAEITRGSVSVRLLKVKQHSCTEKHSHDERDL